MRKDRYLRIAGRPLGYYFPVAAGTPDPPASRDVFRIWRIKRLLVTNEGYVGLGPIAMRPGDGFFVLYGSAVPVVLRAKYGNHQIVGCCYLHEFMDGEVIREVEEGRRKSINIAID